MTISGTTSRAAQLLAHLDAHRTALLDTIRSIPAELHHRKPAPDCWSVADVLEHLTLVEPRLVQLLSSRIKQAPALDAERQQGDEDVAARLDHAAIVDRRRRISAGDVVQPRGALGVPEALAMLATTREQLRAIVSETDGVDLTAVAHPHPALGEIDLVQWILFVGSHEARHTAQIREIVAAVESRA